MNGDIIKYYVHGNIRMPSGEPQGSDYSIASCGRGCQVLMRVDKRKFDQVKEAN